MTPKEKAKELFEKMLFCYQGHIDEYTAKQCALIAVEEIIDAIDAMEDRTIFIDAVWHDAGSEWLKVKEEINKI